MWDKIVLGMRTFTSTKRMFAAAPDDEVTSAPPSERWRRSLLLASVLIVAAAGSYAVTRTLFTRVRAAAVIPAQLTVDTQPAGAELLIDEQPRGTTPATLSIGPGSHTLAVRIAGEERRVKLALAAGAQVAQHFDFASNVSAVAPGRVSIVTDPPGLRVAVDGQPRGVAPLMIDDLTATEHVVTVASDSGVARRTISVTNGVTKEVVFSMSGPTAPVAGWVTVASPFPVDLIEHGEVVGTSGTAKIMLAAGRHDVVVRNEAVGYEAPRTVDVVPGRVAALQVIPPEGRLNVNARPWADVLIDGIAVGQTPLANVALGVGPHQITFRHPELGERTERVVITAKGVNRVAVDLGK
jgi:PEGA domain-containing protein